MDRLAWQIDGGLNPCRPLLGLHGASKRGWNVAATARRPETLEALASAPNVAALRLDVTEEASIDAAVAAAVARFGAVDVLVNNAGIMQLATIADADDAFFDRHIAINLKGVFNGMRQAARRLRNGGRIISFSSSVVGLYQPTYGIYAATKAAVEAMTHILAKELGPRRITVNAVAPGPVATELFLQGKDAATIEGIKRMNPFGRLGEVEDIARVVSLLVDPDATWISGQVVRANGGVV